MKITLVGAGSTIFMKNIVGDVLHFPALSDAKIALMDIDATRLEESRIVAEKLVASMSTNTEIATYSDQRAALAGADFVIVAFQIGGYKPCTVTDFEIPRKYGLRQTIGDTLGVGGIMRGLRAVPHLWSICEDMLAVCPDALMLQYVNPMAINTWAISARYPAIKQVGLCHSVQGTAEVLARDLEISVDDLRYTAAGINHMAFFLNLQERRGNGKYRNLYPALRAGYRAGTLPKENIENPRCPNHVRYEVMTRLGYFVTESSEHFAEYVPWFIKRDRPDLIERFHIPLDEYPQRCQEQISDWHSQAVDMKRAKNVTVEKSNEYAVSIINSITSDTPTVIYGNIANDGYIPQLPQGAAVEVPCLVDANGVQPTVVTDISPQLIALMRTNLNVQELTVQPLLNQDRSHIYHAAMLDPHTAAEMDIDQIHALVDDLIQAHGTWMPTWVQERSAA